MIDLQGGHGWQIWHMGFSPDGSKIVTASFDGTARLWDAHSGKALAVLSGHEGGLQFAEFSPDGTTIVTTADDATARLWNAAGKPLHRLAGHTEGIQSAKFDTQSQLLLTNSLDGSARLWNMETGLELFKFEHGSSIGAVDFSPDDRGFSPLPRAGCPCTRPTMGSGLLQEVAEPKTPPRASGTPLPASDSSCSNTEGINSAVFSADGKRIITAAGDVQIWDAATGKRLARLTAPKGAISNLALSRDGRHIVGISVDKSIHVWDAESGKRSLFPGCARRHFPGHFHPRRPTHLDGFTRRGHRLWPVDPLAAAIKRKPRELTAEERERHSIVKAGQ